MTTRKIITSLILSIAISSQVHAASAVIGGFTVDNIEDSLITINKDNVTWIGGFHNNHFTLFDTVSSENNRVWVMQSWAKGKYTHSSKGTPVGSMKMYFQLDCAEKRIKPLQGIMYSGYFGQGNSVGSSGEDKWIYATPGTTSQYILSFGCAIIKAQENNK